MLSTRPIPNRTHRSLGLTLIELLVVISIVGILVALMIPRLRIINEDRGIRENGRVVASAFASASQLAANSGVGGLLLERHPNAIEDPTAADKLYYATTTFFTMRGQPPYLGDASGDTADVVSGGTAVEINTPLEHAPSDTPPRPVIKINDQISLNNSSARYRISAVGAPNNPTAGKIRLTLDLAGYLPSPSGTGIPFVVFRQPRPLESSRTVLPEGFMIDLRYSGPVLTGTSVNIGTAFNQPIDAAFPAAQLDEARKIRVIFDQIGALDRYGFYDNQTTLFFPPTPAPGANVSYRPNKTLYLFVTQIESDTNIDPLLKSDNLWVTVSPVGSVNVAYNAPPSGNTDEDNDGNVGTLADRILEARSLAEFRQSAAD